MLGYIHTGPLQFLRGSFPPLSSIEEYVVWLYGENTSSLII